MDLEKSTTRSPNTPVYTYMLMRRKELRQVELMTPNRRRRPASTLKLIQRPAPAVILARILAIRDVAMNLRHGINSVLYVLLLGNGAPVNAEGRAWLERGEHRSRSGAVDVV